MDETIIGEPLQEGLLDYAATVSAAARRFLAESLDSLPRNSQGAKHGPPRCGGSTTSWRCPKPRPNS